MGLSRRGSSRSGDGMIWPGFVDAVTTLLMVLMFVLTIFTVMQSVLRQTITARHLSPSTVFEAYYLLEARGFNEGNTTKPGDFVIERAFVEQ